MTNKSHIFAVHTFKKKMEKKNLIYRPQFFLAGYRKQTYILFWPYFLTLECCGSGTFR